MPARASRSRSAGSRSGWHFGAGALGSYTTTLVASNDVKVRIVSQAADRVEDWGHDDPLRARDADAEVWGSVLDWILAR